MLYLEDINKLHDSQVVDVYFTLRFMITLHFIPLKTEKKLLFDAGIYVATLRFIAMFTAGHQVCVTFHNTLFYG
jgi:hypothetical protein